MAADGSGIPGGGCHVNSTRAARPATEAVREVTGSGRGAGDGDAVRVRDKLTEGVTVADTVEDKVYDGVPEMDVVRLDVVWVQAE
jgi:hypothetical protein